MPFWRQSSLTWSWGFVPGLSLQGYKTKILSIYLFRCFTSQVNSYVIEGRSVQLPPLYPRQAWTSSVPLLRAYTFACNWLQPFLNDSAEGRIMTVEIISWSISKKVWDRARINLATPGSAVRLASVARHVTDCPTRLKYLFAGHSQSIIAHSPSGE